MERANWLMLAAAVWLAGGFSPAAAQEQHYKLGGSAGFAFPRDPDRMLGRSGDVGGFIGFRFGDRVSLEAGISYSRSTRRFTAEGKPVEEGQVAASSVVSTRYGVEATLLYNLGRRSQFHPFLLVGAGAVRRADTATTGAESASTVEYKPAVSFGGGFDLYVFHNLAARAEARSVFPSDTERRSFRFLFGATYFY